MRIAWTGEELKRLVALVDAEGRDWSRIASLWRSAGYSARSEKSLEGRTEQPTSRSLYFPRSVGGPAP